LRRHESTVEQQRWAVLGVLGYYRKFVPDFASMSSVLSDLTKKGRPDRIVWTEECQKALDKLKTLMSSKPVLVLPDLSLRFILRTDASDHGIGACLLQEREGLLHPVFYVSRKLLPRETRYAVIERECLAIVWAVGKLSRYLFGCQFTIQTDHKPLEFLSRGRSTSGRLSRWALILQQFNYIIESISGASNVTADILSRLI